MNRLPALALCLLAYAPAFATTPQVNEPMVPGPDGRIYSAFPAGDVTPTPPYVSLSWDLSSALATAGINTIACGTSGTDFSHDVRQYIDAGTNAATADISVSTISGSTWATAGGNDPGSGDNLTFECDDPDADTAGSIRLTADDSNVCTPPDCSTATTTTKTWAAFAQAAPPPADRTGVVIEISGATLDACSNCQVSDLNADNSVPVDGFRVKHLGNSQYHSGGNVPAAVAAVDHFSIIAGSATVGADAGVTATDGDNRWFRGTLYPEPYDVPGHGSTDFDYSVLNGQPTQDKPRIDFITTQAMESAHAADANFGGDRVDHYLAFSLYLASDYVEDCSGGWQEALLQLTSQYTTPNNNFTLDIDGSSGCSPADADIVMSRWVANPGASSGTKFTEAETDVTPAMLGAWQHHVVYFNIDNRTSGATPKFEWTITDDDCNVLFRHVNNTTRWGFDTTGAEHWRPTINLPYKGGWHNATSGTYDGVKDEPIVTGLDAFRIGGAASSYEDVHPKRCAAP